MQIHIHFEHRGAVGARMLVIPPHFFPCTVQLSMVPFCGSLIATARSGFFCSDAHCSGVSRAHLRLALIQHLYERAIHNL